MLHASWKTWCWDDMPRDAIISSYSRALKSPVSCNVACGVVFQHVQWNSLQFVLMTKCGNIVHETYRWSHAVFLEAWSTRIFMSFRWCGFTITFQWLRQANCYKDLMAKWKWRIKFSNCDILWLSNCYIRSNPGQLHSFDKSLRAHRVAFQLSLVSNYGPCLLLHWISWKWRYQWSENAVKFCGEHMSALIQCY